MRLVYVTSFFPPDRIAGAELGTHFMATHMAKQGHEVHVVITRPLERGRGEEKRSGYTIHWLSYLNLKGLRFFSEIKAGLKKLEILKPDIVHGNCLLPGGFIAAKYASKTHAESIVLCYGYDVSDMGFLQSYFGKYAIKNCTKIMAASKYTASKVKSWVPKSEPQTFYAGYDDNAFPLLPKVEIVDKKNILFIGRLIPEKGFDLLISVMEKLDDTYYLTVIGSGELESVYKEEAAEKKINQRIEFLGNIANTEITNVMKKSHVLLLPSKREPFGVVCIEAIASGIPVICSNVMGLPEAVCDGENGFVLKDFDVNSWVKAVEKICTDNGIREKIYTNAQKYHNQWKWSERLNELENIYKSL